jgi:hypothetical protein
VLGSLRDEGLWVAIAPLVSETILELV